jgi:hypothetical protein
MKVVILILLISILSACQNGNMNLSRSNSQEHYSYYREDGLMRDEFWREGEASDLPKNFEAVSVDENGKETGGDTHFHFLDEEVGISYQIYDSSEIALNHLNQSGKKAYKIIRKGAIRNDKGEEIGQKVLFVEKSEATKNEYSLVWTKKSRFTILSSSSLKSVEAYEKDRKL